MASCRTCPRHGQSCRSTSKLPDVELTGRTADGHRGLDRSAVVSDYSGQVRRPALVDAAAAIEGLARQTATRTSGSRELGPRPALTSPRFQLYQLADFNLPQSHHPGDGADT